MRLATLEAEYRATLPEKVWVNAAKLNEPEGKTACEYIAEVLQAIHEKGHKLCKRGAFIVCAHCRIRRKPGNHTKWIEEQCPGIVKVDTSTDTATIQESAPIQGDPVEKNWIQVSRATAKRLGAERRKAERIFAAKAKQVKAAGQALAVQTSCTALVDELEILEETQIPFEIHSSHSQVIELGGFVGCPKCARIASVANARNRMTQPCRGTCPKGSKGRLNRMARGVHLLAGNAKHWLDVQLEPKPRRIHVAR